MAKTSRAHLHTRHLDIGMHPERREISVKLIEHAVIDKAGAGQRGAKRRIGMALGQYEAVTVRPIRLVRA